MCAIREGMAMQSAANQQWEMARLRKRVADLYAMVGADGAEAEIAREQLLVCLQRNGKTWALLTTCLKVSINQLLKPDDAATIITVHEKLGANDAMAATAARQQIKTVLERAGHNWNDLTNLLREALAHSPEWHPNLLDALVDTINEYLWFPRQPHDAVATALWIMHTYVYDRFMHSPRLALMSQEPQSGKSTLRSKLMPRLVRSPCAIGHTTAAALFRKLHNDPKISQRAPTALLEEAARYSWGNDFIALINIGYEPEPGLISRCSPQGSAATRAIFGLELTNDYYVFGPLAFGWFRSADTKLLPLDTLSRCINIDMERAPKDVQRHLKRFNAHDPEQMQRLADLKQQLSDWAANVDLNHSPTMELGDGRLEDNWRPLISIADSIGRGEIARKTAAVLSQRRMNDSVRVRLLRDIRVVLNSIRTEPIKYDVLVTKLNQLEECSLENGELWNDWSGESGRERPHKLTTREVSRILRSFGPALRARTVRDGKKTYRGYMRSWFEPLWAQYCPHDDDTTTQSRELKHLRMVKN
jgi:hypothetical protein